MSDYVSAARDASDQFLSQIADYQETWLQDFARYQKYVSSTMPVKWPYLATFRELVEANFAFSLKLLLQQQAFTRRWYHTGATTPAKPSKPAAIKSARPATKRKATPRKRSAKTASRGPTPSH